MTAQNLTTGLGLPLESAMFTMPPLHIPDATGRIYKTELVLVRTPERVLKINWWHAPDIRKPHNHPWPFRSTILVGGYTETRYWVEQEDGMDEAVLRLEKQPETVRVLKKEQRSYKVGDVNEFPTLNDPTAHALGAPGSIFHTVDEVLPGTVTQMECAALTAGPGDWGYLNLETLQFEKAQPDPNFRALLDDANRFRLKK